MVANYKTFAKKKREKNYRHKKEKSFSFFRYYGESAME